MIYFYLSYPNAISDERTKRNPYYTTITSKLAKIAQTATQKRAPGNHSWLMSRG